MLTKEKTKYIQNIPRVLPFFPIFQNTNNTNPQDNQCSSLSSSMSPINDYIEDSPESISATIDSEDKASAASLQVDTDKDPNESSASQHHTLHSLRSRPRTLAVSLAPIATKLHRKIKVDEDVHRHLDYSPASFPSLDPNIYPTRRHSPSLLTDANHALNFRRHRWNLARVNYCELERLDDYCPQSG